MNVLSLFFHYNIFTEMLLLGCRSVLQLLFNLKPVYDFRFLVLFTLCRNMKVDGTIRIKDMVTEKHDCQMETHMKACTIVALAKEWGHTGE